MKTATKAIPLYSPMPFRQLAKVRGALCPDGVRRTVNVGTPDTFFSVPGRTKVRGTTVTGFVMNSEDDWQFYPDKSGRNGAIFDPRP